MGSERSLTGGVASPISAPPVDASTTRSTPARRAASSTRNVPSTLTSKFISGSCTEPITEPAAARWMTARQPVKRGVQRGRVADIALDQFGVHAGQVRGVPGAEVVEHPDPVASCDQPSYQRRTHETGAAGHQDSVRSSHKRGSVPSARRPAD